MSATLKIRTQFALVTLLNLASALLCGVVNADELSAIRRIGVLDANFSATMGEGIRDGIRQAGYIEGKDIVLDWRRSLGPEEELRSLAIDLTHSKVELIVAIGSPATRAALKMTDVPVVFISGDPVGAGFAASLAQSHWRLGPVT